MQPIAEFNTKPEYVPLLYHGYSYSIRELIRFITMTLERNDSTVKVVPYRNKLYIGKLNEVLGNTTQMEFKEEIPEKLIAWRVIKQSPGSKGSDPFVGIKERKPQYREIRETESGGEIRWGWYIDNLIGWSILAKSHNEELELAEWFRSQMLLMTPAISYLGALRFMWLGMGRSKELDYAEPMNDIHEELYFIRTEEVSITEESILRDLLVELGIDTQTSEKYNKFIDKYIDGIKREMIIKHS